MKNVILAVGITVLAITVVTLGFLLWQSREREVISGNEANINLEELNNSTVRNPLSENIPQDQQHKNTNYGDESGSFTASIKKGKNMTTTINDAGYTLLTTGIENGEDVDRFEVFLLQKGADFFKYHKSSGDIYRIKELALPNGWDVRAQRSVTLPGDFFISFILRKKLAEPGMFEYETVDTRTYLINDKNIVEKIADKLSDEINAIFSCEVYDSYNKRFLTWYCGEGVGSTAPVVAKNYKGNIISSALANDIYFSHKYNNNDNYIVNILMDNKDQNLLIATKSEDQGEPSKRVFNIEMDKIIK